MSAYRAAVVRTPTGPDSITIIRVQPAEPGPGEVMVAVAASAVNPVDVATAAGLFHSRGLVHQPHHTGLGWDFSGTVVSAGPGVELPVGARVAGLVAGFDRDFGTHAEQLVLPAADVAVVPDDLDLATAATVPLNGLAAAQAADLLGSGHGRQVLVTGAAGAVGAYVVALVQDRGWRVTGLARAEDEGFVRGLGAGFVTVPSDRWDAVVDAAVLHTAALSAVGDRGTYVGLQPGNAPAAERGITTREVVAAPDGRRLAPLLAAVADGRLAARVHAVVPLDRVADVHREVAKGGVRGKYVLRP
jgi:NADPH:quinone reductase-like Zn-dependent oxidoreductase